MTQYKPTPIDLFPVPLSKIGLSTDENNNIKELYLSSIHENKKGYYLNEMNPGLVHHKDVFTHYTELLWLKEKLEKHANFVYKDIMNHVTNLEITDVWFNYAKKGTAQHIHNHANSVLSGTLFIDIKDDFLIFHSPYHQPISCNNVINDPPAITENKYGYNYHQSQKIIDVLPGTILYWPSYLKHSYKPTKHPGRLSMSFNFLPMEFNDLYSIKPKN